MTQPSNSLALTYFRAIALNTDETVGDVSFNDLSGWHRVHVDVPTADINDIFKWTRELGDEAPTVKADYYRLAAMLTRSFNRFDDVDTPLQNGYDEEIAHRTVRQYCNAPCNPLCDTSCEYYDVSEEYINLVDNGDKLFRGGLSLTTPPSVGSVEIPQAVNRDSLLLPSNFNTLILRWVLYELYGTSRPGPGEYTGLAKAYDLVKNITAAKNIAADLSSNPVAVERMLREIVTNAPERYFDVSDSELNDNGNILSGYAGLVNTDRDTPAGTGNYAWREDDTLSIPLKINIGGTFDGETIAPLTFVMVLHLKDNVYSWRAPYAIAGLTTTTLLSEYTTIDDQLSGYITDLTGITQEIINDASAGLLSTYGQARTMQDYFLWIAAGTPSTSYADINYFDASSDMWIAYSDLSDSLYQTYTDLSTNKWTEYYDLSGAYNINLTYLPPETTDPESLQQAITDLSGDLADLKPTRDRFVYLKGLVDPPADPPTVLDLSDAAYTLETGVIQKRIDVSGYLTNYKTVNNVLDASANPPLRGLDIQHNALQWWALSAFEKNDAGGWAAINQAGEYLDITEGAVSGAGVTQPIYLQYDIGGIPIERIDVSGINIDGRIEDLTVKKANLAAATALLRLANLGTNTAYKQKLQGDVAAFTADVAAATVRLADVSAVYYDLADTSLVELILDGSGGDSIYYNPTTKTTYMDPSGDRVVASRPYRDASGYVLDALILADTDTDTGFYEKAPVEATLSVLYPRDMYSSSNLGAVHQSLLFYTPYTGVPRLGFEEDYERYYESTQQEIIRDVSDSTDLRNTMIPIYDVDVMDPSGDTLLKPDEKYAALNTEYTARKDAKDKIDVGGVARTPFIAYLHDVSAYNAVGTLLPLLGTIEPPRSLTAIPPAAAAYDVFRDTLTPYADISVPDIEGTIGKVDTLQTDVSAYVTKAGEYLQYRLDVSGWMSRYGSTYVDLSAGAINSHFTGVTGADPFIKINEAGFAALWPTFTETGARALLTAPQSDLTDAAAALRTFFEKAPLDLDHTQIADDFIRKYLS